ncbi:hypothetical protein SDC9_157456 [bioreactor metagenome]|uniref:Uncharacterized protein n=1 Tax=bioreactor metagenome TaxID=1076179 RepID=A0A645F7A4_9ZZZZ
MVLRREFLRLDQRFYKTDEHVTPGLQGIGGDHQTAAGMPGRKIAAAQDHFEPLFFGAEIVRSPGNSGVDLSAADRLLNRRRVFEFEDLDVFAPVQPGRFQRAAEHRVAAGQPDCGDFLSFQIGERFDLVCVFRLDDDGGVFAHDSGDDPDVGSGGDVDQRRGRSERTRVQFAGAHCGQSVGGVDEFDQLHVEPVLFEDSGIFGDEEFTVSGHRQVADFHLVGGGRGGCDQQGGSRRKKRFSKIHILFSFYRAPPGNRRRLRLGFSGNCKKGPDRLQLF